MKIKNFRFPWGSLRFFQLILFSFLLFCPVLTLSSQEDSPAEERDREDVEGLENWSYGIDVNGLDPGIYNFMIEGIDRAGNRAFSDPINLYVDPDSDKPVVSISHPESGALVPGKLNVIGTAVDDDGISLVEVSVNGGAFLPAEGREFWSYNLDTSVLEDGPCLIALRGTDIHGVQGDVTTLEFTLDRTLPVNEILSHGNGELVHDKIRLEGRSTDGNRIGKIEMSLDGKSYREVSWKQGKKDPSALFEIKLDTEELDDGAQILWIRSTDLTGSEGITPFLLFIDNNPPVLDILSPGEDRNIDGRFTIVGTALDDIGLASLACRAGKEDPVDIPLIPGDPYWAASFDLGKEKKADILFTLTDLTGNRAEYRFLRELDHERDKPQVDLRSPLGGDSPARPLLAGFVSDDDGFSELYYSLDGGEFRKQICSFSFLIPLENLSPGEHRLEYYGVDRYGTEGDRTKTVFTLNGSVPAVGMEEILPLAEGTPLLFEQGLELEPGVWKSLNGRISFDNGAGSASYSLDGGEEKTLSLKSDPSGDRLYSFPLKDLLPGYHTLIISARDRAGETGGDEFYFTIKGSGERGFHVADSRFSPPGKAKQTPLIMEEKDRIIFYWEGDAPAEAALSQDLPFLSLTRKDSRLILESRGEGVAEDLSISVRLNSGREETLGPFSLVADSTSPEIGLNLPEDRVYGSEDLVLSGEINEGNSLEEASYFLDEGSPVTLDVADGAFEVILPMADIPEGNRILTVRARDRSGRISEKIYPFRKDGVSPGITQIAPLENRGTNGAISFIGEIDDPEMLVSVEFAGEGINFVPLEGETLVRETLSLAKPEVPAAAGEGETATPVPEAPGEPLFRLTDRAGNVTLYAPRVLIDPLGDQPVVLIQIPEGDTLIQGDFSVNGMAFDDDGVASLTYRLDGGEEISLTGNNSFEIPLLLKDLADNDHLLEIRAVDINGIAGEWTGLSFPVSREEPRSRMEQPAIGKPVRGVVEIQGYSEDANGIDRVYISFDNGNSYNLMAGEAVPEEEGRRVLWTHPFNTKQLADGNHALLIKSVDKYGVTGFYTTLLTIDNRAPDLEIRQPREGEPCTGALDLEGFLNEEGELARVTARIQSLEDPAAEETVDLPLESLIRHTLDLSRMPEGWVNLRISAEDVTGNVTHISRNVERVESVPERRITLLTPVNGADLAGDLLVQGMAENVVALLGADVFVDGRKVAEGQVKDSGYFSALLEKDSLAEGEHLISVTVRTGQGDSLESEPSRFIFNRTGPWIGLDGLTAGDYAQGRPWLTGTAGYDYIAPPLDDRELKDYTRSKAVEKVEISLDNGKTFLPVNGREEWKYRLETQELGNGELRILLRARFADDRTATVKTVLIVDETPPQVELLTPDEGSRFNDSALFTGTAEDENGLKLVQAVLREGNKNQYQVPAFIQGLYLDFHFLGSTFYEAGVGLTFFDDNVKLQLLAGQAPTGRFNGNTMGIKLLANVAALPWDYFFGYDFERFSSSFAVGTIFEYFSMDDRALIGEEGIVLGAMLAQAELLKIEVPDWKMFSAFSLYAEMQFWVISSDVDAGIAPRLAFGVRTNVF